MFERYTEKARRAIFFARYEASEFGSRYIEPEHLLLGLLRESDLLFPDATKRAELKSELARELPRGERIAISVDLPLATNAKRALAYGAEEAEAFKQQHIHPAHVLLGILRLEDTLAQRALVRHGITLERARQFAAHSPEAANKNKQIVEELEREMARMSEQLTYEIEPAVTFSLKALDDRS